MRGNMHAYPGSALEALLSHALLDLDTRSSHHASNYPIETPQLSLFPCVSRVDLTKTGGREGTA
jgi:hypothetical protein